VFAKDVRVEKKDGVIPGKPGQFEAYWWFAPVVENGGSTPTKKCESAPKSLSIPVVQKSSQDCR
jgi:hypothetical protein